MSGTLDPVQKAAGLVNSVAQATFGNGIFTCTFDAAGLCSSASNFSVLVTPSTSQTSSADWIITNLRAAPGGTNDTLQSLTINLIAGLSVFNPRVDSTGHPTANGNGSCAPNPAVATPGFGTCEDIQNGQGQTTAGGLTTATATVLYTNEARLNTDIYHGDLWGSIVLTFTQTSGLTFNPNTDFQFKIDTDGVGAAAIDTPEPSSMVFLGLGLAALFLRKKLQVS